MDQIKTLVAREVANLLKAPAAELLQWLEYPPNPDMGDLSLPCFKLSKTLRMSPQAIADDLKERLQLPEVEQCESAGGYLNIFFHRAIFSSKVTTMILNQGEHYGARNDGAGQTVVFDFSSPNIAKPFHIAHLRSTVIGNALYRIHSFLGYTCIGINHLGDWGTQFGKLITAYHHWGSAEKVDSGGIDELLRLYVHFHDQAEYDFTLEDQARAWFVKMEQGDQEALRLWRWFVDISLKEFNRIYELLNVQFDHYTGESFYNDKLAAIVSRLKDKGLLEEDKGAWLIRLDKYDMPPALILKQDGSSLYHTRDIAAAIYRKETYSFNKAIYITDYAQNLHFGQCFKIIGLLGYEWANELNHVAFGRVSIDGAGLSTRKGKVIKLEDVLEQAISKVKTIIEKRNPGLENIDEVARQVGVGAIIFNDLSANRIKDISFSWEETLNFDGETGPYVQYAHARACSVLTKATRYKDNVQAPGRQPTEHLGDDDSYELVKLLSLFPEQTRLAMQKLEPSIISRYLIDVAQAFSRFYHECPIITADAPVRQARIALVHCVKITLRNGLNLIGLQAPEKI